MIPRYNTSTRALFVASTRSHLEALSTGGLALLLRSLPIGVRQGAHIYCSLTGLRTEVVRAAVKHNVSFAYEVKALLDEREQQLAKHELQEKKGNE